MNLMVLVGTLEHPSYGYWTNSFQMVPIDSAKALMPKIDMDYYMAHPDELPYDTDEVLSPKMKYKTRPMEWTFDGVLKQVKFLWGHDLIIGFKKKPIGMYNVGRATAEWIITNMASKSRYDLVLTSFNNDKDFSPINIVSIEFDYKNHTIVLPNSKRPVVYGKNEVRSISFVLKIGNINKADKKNKITMNILELRDGGKAGTEAAFESYTKIDGINIPIGIVGIDIVNQQQFEQAADVFLTN